MLKKIDHTGKQYYNWTVLYFIGTSNSNKNSIWKCRCKCGIEKNVRISQAINGHSKQCGRCGALTKYPDIIPLAMWNIIKRNAIYRKIEFSLSREDALHLYEKQERRCALSGCLIDFAETNEDYRKGKQTASLDRIDSSKGYTFENVQWVHKKVNIMKMDLSQKDFIDLCKLITYKNESN